MPYRGRTESRRVDGLEGWLGSPESGEERGACLPTRILKSRIFKKYPAARFSSLTWLRSLDARARLPTSARIRGERERAASVYRVETRGGGGARRFEGRERR